MLYNRQLRDAKSLIEAGDIDSAKLILVPYLQAHPDSADAWWLFATLPGNEADAVLALQRALQFDPGHVEARRALRRLEQKGKTAAEADKPPPGARQERVLEDSPDDTRHLMYQVARVYTARNWKVTDQSPDQITFARTTGVSWTWVAIAMVVLPFVGFVLLFANLIARRSYQVRVSRRGEQLHFEGDVPAATLHASQLRTDPTVIPIPETRPNVLLMVGAGVIGLCACCTLGAILLVVAFGDLAEETTFETGDLAFLVSSVGDPCVDAYERPGLDNRVTRRLPVGYQIEVVEVQEDADLSESWYQVDIQNEDSAWVPASSLSHERPEEIFITIACE